MPTLTSRFPALAYPRYRSMIAVRFVSTFALQVQLVAVGWQVYDLSREPFYLGMIGLMQFLPAIMLVLVSGTAADHFPRQRIAAVCQLLMVASALVLAILSFAGGEAIWLFLLLMFVVGVARAFLNPALQALLPNLVPAEHLGSAVSLNSIASRSGAALGPLAGGLLYDASPVLAYSAVAGAFLIGAMLAVSIGQTGLRGGAAGTSLQTLTAGLRYIWETKLILGAVSLDILACLLGTVTALLPVFARDILDAGPLGLGMLRSGPAIGGMSAAIVLGAFPLRSHVGTALFTTMSLFAVSIIVFGLSTTLWVSVVALIVMGASDMTNVYIRWTLVQLWTPDAVRGRVAAVTGVSASGSTELGDFRAGVAAALVGPVAAVALGGAMILATLALWSRLFPELARVQNLTTAIAEEKEAKP